MSLTLLYIVIAAVLGGIVSVLLASLVAWRIQPKLIPVFVSYAVGALLGVVFLDLLPHIFESTTEYHAAAGWLLTGILLFFVLEKLVLWRHDHDHAGQAQALMEAAEAARHSAPAVATAPSEAHSHVHEHHGHHSNHSHHHASGRPSSAWMVIIGDGFHNFTDGFAIAAAFMVDVRLGVLTSLAIIAHELPQELGNFLVLVHSGFSKRRALWWNIVSSLATLVGAVLAYFVLSAFERYLTIFLCFAAASMIYVAIADLIPGLHRRSSLRDSLQQVGLIALGIGSIWIVHGLAH